MNCMFIYCFYVSIMMPSSLDINNIFSKEFQFTNLKRNRMSYGIPTSSRGYKQAEKEEKEVIIKYV